MIEGRDEKVRESKESLITDESMKSGTAGVNQPLNTKQINYALEQIESRHKLRHTPFRITWPFLNYCCCCLMKKRKKRFDLAIKRSLRKRLALGVSKSDQRLEDDPFLMLGFGLNSYFDVMIQLMIMVAIISCVMFPLMYTLSRFSALEQFPSYSTNKYTLGNIGGADSLCNHATFMGGDKTIVSMQCGTNSLIDLDAFASNTNTVLFDIGIIPQEAPVNTYCSNVDDEYLKKCESFVNKDKFLQDMRAECQGKEKCVMRNLKQYVTIPAGQQGSNCFHEDSIMFVQVGCLMPDQELVVRKSSALILGSAGVFIALFVINYNDYMRKVAENGYVEWDVKTITAGDYTIEFDLDPTFFDDYCEQEMDAWIKKSKKEGREYLSKLQSFQYWIQREMEKRLDQTPFLEFEEEDLPVKVAVTTFAFKNAKIINLLRERGTYIRNEQWDQQALAEKKINELKEKEFKQLVTPCSVFMTFETEEGVNRALTLEKAIENDQNLTHLKEWMNTHQIEIQAASEPSDIIWENRQYTHWQRRNAEICVIIIICIMLFGSFVLIFWFSNIANKAVSKYPIFDEQACMELPDASNEEALKKGAVLSYRTNKALEEQGFDTSYSYGLVQCFCDARKKEGDQPDALYDFNGEDYAVCSDYFGSQFSTMILSNGIMVSIIGINTGLKMTIIKLITWIGYDTHSELMTKITKGVFFGLFFNTGILLVLTNSNFSDVSTWLSAVFHGTYYDYSPRWYAMVGSTLVSTMQLNAFMPPIFEFITNAQLWLFQMLDNGFRCCESKTTRVYHTKTSQIYHYLSLYTGPDYIVHYKFSGILNITFVTMMYGLGLPMLFPIAFLSYFIIYATERYQLAYTYQLPPAMDSKMTDNAMQMLTYTPLLFLINGYWMLSNRQMFDNVVNKIVFSTEQMSSAHKLSDMFQMSQATPLLVLSFAIFAVTIMRACCYAKIKEWGFSISSNVIEVDENLPNFFKAIKLADSEWFVKESRYCRQNYKFSFANKQVVDKLDQEKHVPKKSVQGLAWYNLLSNPAYVRDFNYISVATPDREDYIVDGDSDEGNDCEQSDMVSILINLAYVRHAVAESFKFEAGYSKNFGMAMKKANTVKLTAEPTKVFEELADLDGYKPPELEADKANEADETAADNLDETAVVGADETAKDKTE